MRHAGVAFSGVEAAWAALAGIHCDHTQAEGAAIGWQQGNVLGVHTYGLSEAPAVLQALFGAQVPTLEDVFETLADMVEQHMDAMLLERWLAVKGV